MRKRRSVLVLVTVSALALLLAVWFSRGAGGPNIPAQDLEIVDAAWRLEATYQHVSSQDLHADLIAVVVYRADERCVRLDAKPGMAVLGSGNEYCFDLDSTRLIRRPDQGDVG